MVSISHETPEQTEIRLRYILRTATVDPYTFIENSVSQPLMLEPGALALVRDDAVWSQLVPARESDSERFDIWRFHFPPDADNSGFVGWLASHIKAEFGSGVIVICGYNSQQGGVFDYWGVPAGLGDEVMTFIDRICHGE